MNTHTHTPHIDKLLSKTYCLTCACTKLSLFVCVICACGWIIHSYKDTTSPSPPPFLPGDKVPIPPFLPRQRKRWGRRPAGRQGEEKTRRTRGWRGSRKPRCYQPSESHWGHCHVSVTVTQLLPDKLVDCSNWLRLGDSAIALCAGAPDETRN